MDVAALARCFNISSNLLWVLVSFGRDPSMSSAISASEFVAIIYLQHWLHMCKKISLRCPCSSLGHGNGTPPRIWGNFEWRGLITGRFSSNLDWDRDGKRCVKEGLLVLGFGHPFQLQSRVGRSVDTQTLLSRDAARHPCSWRSGGSGFVEPDLTKNNHSVMTCCSRKMWGFFWKRNMRLSVREF